MAIVLPKFSRRRSPAQWAAETEPAVSLTFCRPAAVYPAGGTMTCRWHLRCMAVDQIQGIETSVLWYTEGKGDEDLQVHHFARLAAAELQRRDLQQDQSFQTTLPLSPLSYDGHLLRIRWCVRLRIFLAGGDEVVAQQPFRLIGKDVR